MVSNHFGPHSRLKFSFSRQPPGGQRAKLHMHFIALQTSNHPYKGYTSCLRLYYFNVRETFLIGYKILTAWPLVIGSELKYCVNSIFGLYLSPNCILSCICLNSKTTSCSLLVMSLLYFYLSCWSKLKLFQCE